MLETTITIYRFSTTVMKLDLILGTVFLVAATIVVCTNKTYYNSGITQNKTDIKLTEQLGTHNASKCQDEECYDEEDDDSSLFSDVLRQAVFKQGRCPARRGCNANAQRCTNHQNCPGRQLCCRSPRGVRCCKRPRLSQPGSQSAFLQQQALPGFQSAAQFPQFAQPGLLSPFQQQVQPGFLPAQFPQLGLSPFQQQAQPGFLQSQFPQFSQPNFLPSPFHQELQSGFLPHAPQLLQPSFLSPGFQPQVQPGFLPALPSQQFVPAQQQLLPAPQQFLPAQPQLVPAPQQFVPAPQQLLPAPQQFVPAPQQLLPAPQQLVPAQQQLVPAPQVLVPAPQLVPVG